ncbi:MAG: hypothetical protein EXS03_00755 [Phycisphaerales bacterium]|nr:hypothetical protein [Phycisphaerales bacterium]
MTKKPFNTELVLERLLQLCVSGDRVATRLFIDQAQMHGIGAMALSTDLYWPTMQTVFRMWRQDQLTSLAYQYATRILRMLIDQTQALYEQAPRNGRRLVCVCGPNESEDMAGQLCADILESSGYEVLFAGGGVANDEILSEVSSRRPDALVVFAAAASDAPRIRMLIDTIRTIGATPHLPIVCGGGVFARAPGLAEEIGADATADDPFAVERMVRCALASPRCTQPSRQTRMRAAVA